VAYQMVATPYWALVRTDQVSAKLLHDRGGSLYSHGCKTYCLGLLSRLERDVLRVQGGLGSQVRAARLNVLPRRACGDCHLGLDAFGYLEGCSSRSNINEWTRVLTEERVDV
jgi:hypothetical protein